MMYIIPHRDGSSGYSYTKRRKKDSQGDNQEFVDEWIPFDKPPSSFAEEHIFRAKQVGKLNMTSITACIIYTVDTTTKRNIDWIRIYPQSQ